MENTLPIVETEYPTLLRRVQSSAINAVVILSAMVIFSQIADQLENFPTFLRVAFITAILLYEPLCVALGCTIGHYLMKLRVRKNDHETQQIGFLMSVVRYVVKFFLGLISFLTVHSNPRRRAIHDMVAGSVMIKLE